MSNHHGPAAEFFKSGQNLLNGRCICHHIVINTGKLFYTKRNWNLWIYKLRKTACNLSVFHTYCTNLDNLIFQGGETCGLNIKYYIGILKALSFTVLYDSF